MRTPISGLIILELEQGPATLDEIQTAVTAALLRKGPTKSVFRFLKRHPDKFFLLFKQIRTRRIQQSLDMLVRNLRVQYYPREGFYALTDAEGARSLKHWKERFASGAYN